MMDGSTKNTVTRREILRWGAAAGSLLLSRPASAWFQDRGSPTDVDHIMWGVPDLDEGIAYIEEKTGVRAAMGGVHPNRGTRNALISLGERTYLEILGLDPAQTVENERVERLESLTAPEIFTWAAGTRDIEAVEKRVIGAGYSSGGIESGSRRKPGGAMLEWRNFNVAGHDGTVVPFVIEWSAESTHPATDSPHGCMLKMLQLEHPEPEKMNGLLEALGLEERVVRGPKPKITALIESPKGALELT